MSIPEDVVEDILSRLPVKSVLRFKSVSKRWNHLIRKPSFVSKHYSKQQPTCVFVIRFDPDEEECYSWLSNPQILPADIQTTDLIFSENFDQLPEVFGPCNGLLCLSDSYGNATIWNPSIDEHRDLPKTDGYRFNNFGFGFDRKTNDYKFLRFVPESRDPDVGFEIEVYSLNDDAWYDYPVHGFLGGLADYKIYSHIYNNGVCYCWAVKGSAAALVSFDMADEEFYYMPFPSCKISWDYYGAKLEILNGSLAAITYMKRVPSTKYDIWVMTKQGDGYSWVKQFSIGPLPVRKCLGLWNSNALFLEDSEEQLCLYDPKTRLLKTFELETPLQVVSYSGSLVRVNGRRKGKP